MKIIFATLIFTVAAALPAVAQTSPSGASAAGQEIIELEKQWNAAIQSQDVAGMSRFLADSYFLAVAIEGRPLQVVPRERWLENLKFYKIHSHNIDDIKVNVYGNTAVALMLFAQKATVGRAQVDRSAQFLITDIWVKQNDGWRVAERHSSRPEQPPASPQPRSGQVSATSSNDSDFKAFLRRWEEGQSRFLNGDATLWKENSSQREDATIFGAFGGHEKGWKEVGPRYEWAASQYRPSGATKRVEYLNVIVGSDLAYTVSIERDEAQAGTQKKPEARALRVTQVFRRESGAWKLLHRHADLLMEKKAPGEAPQK